VPERRLVDDRLQRAQDISFEREGTAAQKHGAVCHDFARWVSGQAVGIAYRLRRLVAALGPTEGAPGSEPLGNSRSGAGMA
jgi:hypothetical protein